MPKSKEVKVDTFLCPKVKSQEEFNLFLTAIYHGDIEPDAYVTMTEEEEED